MSLTNLLKVFYTVCALYLALFTAGQGYLFVRYLLLWVRGKHRAAKPDAPQEWPRVLVQLPIYNEKLVIQRLLEAVVGFDYPRDRLTIQVLDDSTDDTLGVVAALVAQYRDLGVDVWHVRRPSRAGYKAGAMAYGLSLAPDVEYVAIFDADFVPASDFLRRTIPYLTADPQAGFVQTRWGHLNAGENWLTGAQALSFDAYYLMEQTARARCGLLLTFNGTGGVWRTAAIRDAGGWSSDTLTEDFDLSYRAQMKGWHAQYLPEIVVPGEIPMQTKVYKAQQMRWATGSNQTLFKHFIPLWSSRLSLHQKVMATIHLTQYTPHPVMLLMMALAPLMITMRAYRGLPLGSLAILSVIVPAMTVVSQMMLGGNWPRRLLNYPFVMVLGTGMMWNNTRALWRAIQSWRTHRELEFVRTPKFAGGSSGIAVAERTAVAYSIPASAHSYVELALAVYALGVTIMAFRAAPSLAPVFGLYAVALAIVGGRALLDR